MADLQISQLPSLAEANIAATDELAIVDTSASETKKVTAKALVEKGVALIDAGSIPGTALASLGANTVVTNSITDGNVTNVKLANSSISLGGLTLALGSTDATPALNLTDATNYPTSSLSGTISNAQLGGSIANNKLANSSISLGGVSIALGATNATPALNLTSATNYPTSALTGTITNAQLAGSIANSKLANSSINIGGVTLSLGGSDTTPALDLADATNYPAGSLTGTITNAQLAGSIAATKLVSGSITSTQLGANSVTDSQLANNACDTSAIQNAAITNDKVETSTNSSTGLDGATKIRDATITPAKLNTSNLDRSINVASGNLGINNTVSAATRSGITYNAQGLITGTVALAAGDLPIATASAVGGVSVGSGLSVTGAGALSLSTSVTGATVSGITFNNTGQITAATALVASDLPIATTSAKGAVQITSGGGLTVDGSGNLITSTSGISAGTYTKLTINTKGVATSGTTLAASDIPDLAASKITSGSIDAARIGNDTIDGTKLSNASTAIFQSIAQSGYPTAQFNGQILFDTVSEDAFIYDGNAWQAITTLTKGSLVFGGTYNANTSKMASTTTAGIAAGLAVGSNLPSPSSTTDGVYVVVDTAGTAQAPAPVVAFSPPDYILGVTNSSGSSWNEIDLSQTVAGQVASNITFTPYGQLSSTNVQDAMQELETEKLAKAGGEVTGQILIGNTGSLVFEGSTVDAYETTITVADPTSSDKTITFPDTTGTVITTGDTGTVTGTMLANGTIQNVDIKSDAAIAYSKLASVASGYILVGNGASTSVAAAVAVTGDISINNAGLTSITAGAIVNADISNSAQITGSKVVTGTTSAVGVLQLTNAADSTSATTAATPAAVKTAKDAADAAQVTADAALPKAGGTMTDHLVIDNGKELRLSESDGDGTNYTGLKAQAQTGDITLTLPAVAPTAGQVLKADASTPTTLTWAADSSTDATKMPLTGGTFTGDVIFAGDSSNVVWDKSASAFTGTIAATAFSGPLTGTIQTAAQANITSIGTLTSLGISGNLTVDTNTLHVDATNNRVLIGRTTTNTGYPLCVEADGGGENILLIGRSADDISEIGFFENDTTTRLGEIQYRQDHVNFRHRVGDIRFCSGGSSEMMRIDSSGRLLLGTTATTGASFGSTPLAIFESSTTNNYGRLGLIYNGDDAHASALTFGKSRGTSDGSNTVVQADDQIGSLFFQGADGTDKESRAAAIMAFVDGTPGSNDMPGRLTFLTTADGAASPTERMRIDSSGRVLLGTTTEGEGDADNLTIADSGHCGISIRSGTSSNGFIMFSDGTSGADEYRGYIAYRHGTNVLDFATNGTQALTLDSSQNATFAGSVTSAGLTVDTNTLHVDATNNKVGIGTTSPNRTLSVKSNGGQFSIIDDDDSKLQMYCNAGVGSIYASGGSNIAGSFQIFTTPSGQGSVQALSIDSSQNAAFNGTVSDSKGNLRSVPVNSQGSTYTLVAADAGKAVALNFTNGGCTINTNLFVAGDVVTLINASTTDKTITRGSGLNLYNSADGTDANRTLSARGMATLIFVSHDGAFISGAGLS